MKPLHLLLVMSGLLVVSHSAPAAATHPITLYVAPDGNDAWSGRAAEPNAAKSDGPFATVGRAQKTLRALRIDGALPGPVTIRIRGTHRLAEPLVITPDDSGTAETPVTFTGYAGEKPTLSGGRAITGWQEAADGVWTVQIPAVQAGEWRFLQLFVDGSRRRPARSPNTGYCRIAELLPGPPDPRQADRPRQVRVCARRSPNVVAMGRCARRPDALVGNIHPSDQVDRYRNEHCSVYRADA